MGKRLLNLLILLLFIAGTVAVFAGGSKEAAGGEKKSQYPPEMEKWLKEAKLGPYEEHPQNWKEIEAKAKEEGEVVVYSSSSRVAKVAKLFEAKYPGIKVKYFDLGSVKTVEKTVSEQKAGLFNADIVTTGGSGEVINNLLKNNMIVNFVPDTVGDKIPKKYKDPLLVRINEAIVFYYNTEAYDKPPIKNIWELTMPEWKGRVVTKDPNKSLSVLMGFVTLVQHAKELEAAYKRLTGKDLVLHDGVPDAGYEFIYRLLHNDLIILKSGGKVAAASGKRGQKNPPISIIYFTYLRYNDSKKYANGVITPLDPVEKLVYPTYTAIARQAPHPNAAKLFTAFLMGSPKLTKDTVLEPPYTEGKAAELLQGLAPYFDPGSASPRTDVPKPKGGEIWDELKGWDVDPDFMWYNAPKIQDFWTQEVSK